MTQKDCNESYIIINEKNFSYLMDIIEKTVSLEDSAIKNFNLGRLRESLCMIRAESIKGKK